MKRPQYGVHRLPSIASSRTDHIERTKAMLARAFNLRTVVTVIGSGLSQTLDYPSWHRFTSDLVQFTLKQIRRSHSQHERLRDFLERLKKIKRPDYWELVFFLGFCQRLLSTCPDADASKYFKKLMDVFRYDDKPDKIPNNPYDALAKLPINRYVTTNYDCEIERALAREHELSLAAFGIPYPTHESSDQKSYFLDPGKYLSFTQTPESREQLALFALARLPEPSHRVFHCHGRFDDPRSMVVTEADYQKWYLSDGANINPTFFQSLDLLFSSNPILFLGYSLRDDDLLRPLRIISATESYRKSTRPLFALLPERSEGSDWYHHEFLFERYGIHVIPFPEPRDSTPTAWANTYCAELHQLRDNWEQWRQRWLEKPYFRKVELPVEQPEPYHHYAIDIPEEELLGRSKVSKNCEQLIDYTEGRLDREVSQPPHNEGDHAKPPPRKGCVIVIVGRGGTGKSLHAVKLMHQLHKDRNTYPYAGYFFWSSYYADDYVTGLDRFLNYSGQQIPLQTLSRLERLHGCLQRSRYLIILDGFERMLRQSEVPDEGDAYHPTVKKLLEILSDKHNQSTVVLTSRLWPRDLSNPDDAKAIIRYTLEPMATDDIKFDRPFKDLDRKHRSTLCSLLDGDVYALLLASRTISAPSGAPRLIKALADTPPDRRVSRMIREVVAFCHRGAHGELAVEFLKRIAIFMAPIPSITQELCFQEAKKNLRLDLGAPPDINTILARLVSLCLVFRIDHK